MSDCMANLMGGDISKPQWSSVDVTRRHLEPTRPDRKVLPHHLFVPIKPAGRPPGIIPLGILIISLEVKRIPSTRRGMVHPFSSLPLRVTSESVDMKGPSTSLSL